MEPNPGAEQPQTWEEWAWWTFEDRTGFGPEGHSAFLTTGQREFRRKRALTHHLFQQNHNRLPSYCS